ncbi:MAG: GLPGLI family protein, partial [Ignavibacteriae bacterium]|nr:GLPGLI family protein [Ignavibacteriota bacterium]
MFDHSSKKIFKSILKLFLIYFIAIGIITAQQSKNEGVVQYSFKNNGKISDRASLKLFYKDGIVGYESSFRRDSEKEKEFINYNDNSTYQLLTIDDGVFYQKKSFSEFEEAKILDETENILGYDCKKAVLKIKSNTIEVWFTNELGIKGSPSTSVAPGLGLILKMVRNRDYETFATNIDFRTLINEELNFDLTNAKEIDGASYYRKLIDSRYQTITVFNREQINYGDTIKNPNEEILDHTYRFSNGTVLLKKIKLPKISNGSTVMAEVNSWSNGDAYDRTGSLFIIPTNKEKSFLDAFKNGIDEVPIYYDIKDNKFQGVITTSNYDPPLELLRFFTPFGVSGFNNYTKIEGYIWADSAKYSQEVTDLIPHNGS